MSFQNNCFRAPEVGVAWIDLFFDFWLPFFVDMVRTLNRGIEAAREMHEEVISKDGVSRPAGRHMPSDEGVGGSSLSCCAVCLVRCVGSGV